MKPLREWDKRAIGDEGLTRPIANRLLGVARASSLGGTEGTRILIDGGRYLRAQNIVGVLAAGEHALEILPKIDGVDDTQGARERLVHMLSTVHDLEIAPGSAAELGVQRETLLEILIRLFADRLIDAVRRGMPRRYVEHSDDLPSLRGRLAVVRQFTTLAANPSRLACRYDDLSPDILLNRIMKSVVQRLRTIARRSETQRRLAELSFAYADVGDIASRDIPWASLHLDRIDRRWVPLVRLAKLILGGDYQTTSSGRVAGTALLFDMGELFEAYVARKLQRVLRGLGYSVIAQGGRRYCVAELDAEGRHGRERFQTRPDILVRQGSEVRMVVDTKWKRLKLSGEEAKRGVVQSDVYQMMAYARLYESSRLMLLYPHHDALDNPGVLARYAVTGGSEHLSIATVDLSALHLVGSSLRELVLGSLEPATPVRFVNPQAFAS